MTATIVMTVPGHTERQLELVLTLLDHWSPHLEPLDRSKWSRSRSDDPFSGIAHCPRVVQRGR